MEEKEKIILVIKSDRIHIEYKNLDAKVIYLSAYPDNKLFKEAKDSIFTVSNGTPEERKEYRKLMYEIIDKHGEHLSEKIKEIKPDQVIFVLDECRVNNSCFINRILNDKLLFIPIKECKDVFLCTKRDIPVTILLVDDSACLQINKVQEISNTLLKNYNYRAKWEEKEK